MTQVQDLITAIRNRTDMLNDQFVTDTEIIGYINMAAGDMDDLLVSTYDDYKLKSASLTITGPLNYVALPSDFYKPRGVETMLDGIQPYTLRPFNFQERNRNANTLFRSPAGPYNAKYRCQDGYLFIEPITAAPGVYTLWYTPAFANFTAANQALPSYMDVQNWCRFIIADCCSQVKTKLELFDAIPVFENERERLRQRILTMAHSRSQGEGKTISSIRNEYDDGNEWWMQ